MKVTTCLICDSANYTDDKRINILGGGITQINAEKLPVLVPLSIVIRLSFEMTEDGAHDIKMRCIDPDGKDIIPIFEQTKTITQSQLSHNLIINMHPIPFHTMGTHRFDIFVNKMLLHSENITVVQRKK
jgi:hypothetical protein